MAEEVIDEFEFKSLNFRYKRGLLECSVCEGSDKKEVLRLDLGTALDRRVKYTHSIENGVFELHWDGKAKLSIEHRDEGENGVGRRYEFTWTSLGVAELSDYIDMKGAHWYGGAQLHEPSWPFKDSFKMPLTPSVVRDCYNTHNAFGGVMERYFLSSAGSAVFIDGHVPLFLSINNSNDSRIVMSAKFQSPFWKLQPSEPLQLKYTVFVGKDITSVHEAARQKYFAKPTNIPCEDLFSKPIWSTWASFHKDINTETVLKFLDNIVDGGYQISQFEIDDDWTPAYGDMDFDSKKFAHPKEMISKIKEKGLKVTLWVHPFASIRSNAAGRSEYFLQSFLRGYTKWWGGIGKCLDVTSTEAKDWFKSNLKSLQDRYGVDSFKFDAGETTWLPPGGYTTHTPMAHPNEYTRLYAELCASVDPDLRAMEVRVGHRTQHLPILVRMIDKDSIWGEHNGLRSVIPGVLTFGLVGYPFVLPDMIGGNAGKWKRPKKELYIRWMELNALMPFVQISIPPWEYDEEVRLITKKMLDLHETYTQTFLSLARQSTQTGAPIMRPLWWLDPREEACLRCDDQFLVGDDLLVAPVVQEAAVTRDVFLPEGKWKCGNTGKMFEEGGRWLKDYSTPLDQLPYFTRVKDE